MDENHSSTSVQLIPHKKYDGLALWGAGVLFGALLAGLIGAISADTGEVTWYREYQTIIASVAALLTASFYIGKLRQQIDQSEHHHREMIARNLIAARAAMPAVLSNLSQLARKRIDIAIALCLRNDLPHAFDQPPAIVYETIREVIKFAEPQDQVALSRLLSHLQVQSARMGAAIRKHVPRDTSELMYPPANIGDDNLTHLEHIIDAEELVSLTAEQFKYARGLPNDSKLYRLDKFHGNFIGTMINLDEWPNLLRIAEERYSDHNSQNQ